MCSSGSLTHCLWPGVWVAIVQQESLACQGPSDLGCSSHEVASRVQDRGLVGSSDSGVSWNHPHHWAGSEHWMSLDPAMPPVTVPFVFSHGVGGGVLLMASQLP